MRAALILALILGLVSATAQAQVKSSVDRPWQLRFAAGWQDFSGGAEDTTTSVNIEVRPSNSIGFELGLARRWDVWEGRMDLGYAKGSLYGETNDAAIKDIKKLQRHPIATKDAKGRLIVGAAIGSLRDPYERSKALFDAGLCAIATTVETKHRTQANKRRSRLDLMMVTDLLLRSQLSLNVLSDGLSEIAL